MLIAIINQSNGKVSDADALKMTSAIADQIHLDVAPVWDQPPASVISYGTLSGEVELRNTVPPQAPASRSSRTFRTSPKGCSATTPGAPGKEDLGNCCGGAVPRQRGQDHNR